MLKMFKTTILMGAKMDSQKVSETLEFLIEVTHVILRDKYYAAKHDYDNVSVGREKYYSFDFEKLESIVEITKPILRNVQETKKIRAKSYADILTLLGRSKITTKEARDIMMIIDKKNESELEF